MRKRIVEGVNLFSTIELDEVLKLAEKVGRKVHRKYPSVEQQDITSEALIRLAEVAEELKAPTAGKVFSVLERAAFKYAAEERYKMMLETSQYVYIPKEVRYLLQCYWSQGITDVPTSKDDYLYAEVEKRVVSISLMDLKSALEDLKPNHRKNLERKFRDEQTVDTKLVHRAIEALVKSLNRGVVYKTKNHDGPGARKAISNHRAQNLMDGLWVRDDEVSQERDAVAKTQAILKYSPSKPAGTHFDWDKYKEDND